MKEMSDLFCGKAAVGGNYNSTRDSQYETEDAAVEMIREMAQDIGGHSDEI